MQVSDAAHVQVGIEKIAFADIACIVQIDHGGLAGSRLGSVAPRFVVSDGGHFHVGFPFIVLADDDHRLGRKAGLDQLEIGYGKQGPCTGKGDVVLAGMGGRESELSGHEHSFLCGLENMACQCGVECPAIRHLGCDGRCVPVCPIGTVHGKPVSGVGRQLHFVGIAVGFVAIAIPSDEKEVALVFRSVAVVEFFFR